MQFTSNRLKMKVKGTFIKVENYVAPLPKGSEATII